MGDVLGSDTNVLVTMEEPPRFARMVRAWEEGGHTGLLAEDERNYKNPERTAEEREEFARYVRDIGYQADLERTGQRPVVSLGFTPPHGTPVPTGGAIHVTRRARQVIENTLPPRPIEDTDIIPAVPAEGHEDPADGG